MTTKYLTDGKVRVVGEISPHLKTDNKEIKYSIIAGYIFLSYYGIQMYHITKLFRNKDAAIEYAEHHAENDKKFSDGTVPFCVVYYHSGRGWLCFTSNISENERIIRGKL